MCLQDQMAERISQREIEGGGSESLYMRRKTRSRGRGDASVEQGAKKGIIRGAGDKERRKHVIAQPRGGCSPFTSLHPGRPCLVFLHVQLQSQLCRFILARVKSY